MGENRNSDGGPGVQVDKTVSFRDGCQLSAVRLTIRNERSVPAAVLIEDRLPTDVTPADVDLQGAERDLWRVRAEDSILYSSYLAANDDETASSLVERESVIARRLVEKPAVAAVRRVPAGYDEQGETPPIWNPEILEGTGPAVQGNRSDVVTDGGRTPEDSPGNGDRHPTVDRDTVDVVDSATLIEDLFDEEDPSLGNEPLALSTTVRRILNRDAVTAPDGGDDPPTPESFDLDLDDRGDETEQAAPPSRDREGGAPSADARDGPSSDQADAGPEAAVRAERGAGAGSTDPPRHFEVRIERLETRLAELDAYTDSLKDLVDERDEMGEQFATLEDQLGTLEDSVAELSATVQHVEAAKEIEQERLEDLDGRVESVTDEIDEVQGSVGDVTADVQMLSDDLAAVDDRIERLATRSDELSGRVDDIDDRLAAVESAVESIDQVRATQERVLDFFDALSTAGERVDGSASDGLDSIAGGADPETDDREGSQP